MTSQIAPSVSKSDIVAGLHSMGIAPAARIFAHSSLRAFGHVDGGADAVCDALLHAAGATIIAAQTRELVDFGLPRANNDATSLLTEAPQRYFAKRKTA